MSHQSSIKRAGFTIAELIIIIAVVGILAALTVVGFRTFTAQAQESALKSNLQTALTNLDKEKKESGDYPATLEELTEGIPGADDFTYTYTRNSQNFCLVGVSKSNSSLVFSVTQNGTVSSGTCTLAEEVAEEGPPTSTTTSEACFAFNAGTKTITDYYANENNNGANPACPRTVVIPNTIGGVAVEVIGDNAFYSDGSPAQSLTALTLPSGLKSIGYESFANNNLTSIVLPSGLETIGWGAFFANSLVTLNIPQSVTSIDENAFDNGTLTDVYLYATTSFTGFSVFGGAQLHYL